MKKLKLVLFGERESEKPPKFSITLYKSMNCSDKNFKKGSKI